MKRTLSSLFACLIFSTASMASINDEINHLINQVDPGLNIGVDVLDLTTGHSLYTRNAKRGFIPASNMKIFSDAAALMILGPDYRFKNQLSTNGLKLQQGILKGNIYLHLPGDPSFTHTALASLLSNLKTWGIKSIKGNIIIVSHLSKVNPYPPGWSKKDLMFSYGAPLAPVIIDTNRLLLTINPGPKAGQKAVIELYNLSGSIIINNKVHTSSRPKGCGVSFNMDNQNHLTVRGCVGQGQWAIQQQVAIKNPLLYMQGLIKKELGRMKIQLSGKIQQGLAPKDALLIATQTSKPMSQLIADTLKPSDNLYAESLYLHTAAALKGKAVNWKEAQTLIKRFLQKQTGINLKTAVLADGSGLSRFNVLSARQTVELLQFLHNKFYFSYEFISALPVSGRDGTLQRRFIKPTQQDFVRAKTGTMTGVISLSGYLYTMNGHTLAFAIYINNTPKTRLSVSGRSRYLVDALCAYLLKQNPQSSSLAKIRSPHRRMSFQNHSPQAKLQRKQQIMWRRIEIALKKALKGGQVSIIYRGKELLVKDHQNKANTVWAAIQHLRKKYPISVALTSSVLPKLSVGKPSLLWVKPPKLQAENVRIWTIREAIS